MARARSFGNIRKLPSGRYQARYWHLGKQIPADTTFANKTDARRWLATIEADMFRGVWIDPNAGKVPFGEYATRWVAERPVRPRTREIYEGQLRHIVAVFADVNLCDCHPVAVRTWHGRLAASGLHHNTVAKIYRLFRSIMTTAVDDGLIASNPVRIKSASAERMIERPLLRWDDVRALAGAIHPRFECLVWTAAASGLRFGELAGLTIEHVSLERRELRVMQALHDIKGQGPTLGPPKTESAVRTVPVAESIAVRMAAHIEEYVEVVEPSALVFTSLRGGPLLNTYFAPQWSKARDAVGLRHVRFHDLRHLAGTEAATAGASLREVMSIMGHASSAASLPFGLQCAAEVESGTYTFEEGAEGFETIEEAARDWMTSGDGAHPAVDASQLEPVAEPTGRVELVDDTGEVRIVLIARDYGNGWLIESTERCFDG